MEKEPKNIAPIKKPSMAEWQINPEEGERIRGLGSCIGSCLVGRKALELVRSSAIRFFDEDQVRGFLKLETISDEDEETKDAYLLDITNAAESKMAGNDYNDSIGKLSDKEIRKFKRLIKTNHIMRLNDYLRDFISEAPAKKNNMTELGRDLKKAYAMATAKGSTYEQFSGYENYEKGLLEVAKGMRHEQAFRELISNANEAISIRDATNYEDSKGVDVILDVKISPDGLRDDEFRFASAEEIEKENYCEYSLFLDIKSSQHAANEEQKRLKAHVGQDHWAIWSHIYEDDFRLTKTQGGHVYVSDNLSAAPLALKEGQDGQIPLMKDLYRYNVMYSDGHGGQFRPKSFDSRIDSVEKEILHAIKDLELVPVLGEGVFSEENA